MSRVVDTGKLAKAMDTMLNTQKQATDMENEYMRGMYNGMEYMRSLVTGQEPVFMEPDGTLDNKAMQRTPERYL